MTGPTLAQLGIQVDNSGVIKAITSLDGMTVAGSKTEAATQRLSRRMGLLEIAAREMDQELGRTGRQMAALEAEARKMDQEMTAVARAMALTEIEARKMDAELGQVQRSMALVEIEARKMDAAMTASAEQAARNGALLEIEARKMDKARDAAKLLAVGLVALTAVGFLGHEFFQNTIEAQDALAQLAAAVQSTGGVAGRSVAQLDAFSMAMQQTTTYSDEAVKGAQAMLLTFDKIRGVQFDQATQAVADLATRMGGDLQGAAVQVGKALQDPATGLTALRRSGVSFSESQIALIKSLYDTGHVAEGQTIILKELEHQFGGSAAAARDTLGGALKGLKNDFGDLFEGTKTETSALVDFIHTLASAARTANEYRDTLKAMGEAAVIAGAGIGTITLAMKANAIVSASGMAGLAAATLPVAALAAAFGVLVVAMQGANEEMRQLQDEADEATKHGKPYLDYLTSLGLAHSSKGGAGALVKPPPTTEVTEAQKKYQQLTDEIEQETAKQRVLNAAFGQSALVLQVLGIRQDEAIKNKKIDVTLSAAQHAAVVALNHEYANQLIVAAKLADAEKERARNSKLALANWQAGVDTEIEQNLKKRADAAKLLEEALKGVAAQTERIRNRYNQAGGDFDAIAAQKYADEMRNVWISGFEQIATRGTKSFRTFFEEVLSMSRAAMAVMERNSKNSGFLYGALGLGSSALGGGFAGYQIGQSTHSTVTGALGGAASGALAGMAIAGPAGAAVGAMAGFVSGIIGVGSAAREAARAMTEAVKQVLLSMESLRATVKGDVLAQGIAAIEADRVARTKAIEDAWSGGGAGSDRVIWRTQQEKELNALEDQRIVKLREEYALSQRYAQEDLDVRKLRAEGHAKEADALARQEAADREITQAIADHRSDEYIATLRYVTGLELATNAMDKASTSALNMVQGYRLQATIFNAMAARTSMVGASDYGAPYVTGGAQYRPPTSTPAGGDLTVQVMMPNGETLGKVVIKDFQRRKAAGDSSLTRVLQS